MSDDEIEVKAFSIGCTTIITQLSRFNQALADDDLGDEYDMWLSDMDGDTFIVAPDGRIHNPSGATSSPFNLIEPILDEIPTWVIEQYVARRRGDEE